MIKRRSLILSVLAVVSVFTFSHCDDDSEPEKSKIGFQSATSSVLEGVNITVAFSQPLPSGAIPDIEFTGTATKDVDYTFQVTESGVVLTTIADGIYDPDETIILTLKGISGNAELGNITVHTVTIDDIEPEKTIIGFQSANSSLLEGANITVAFSQPLPSGAAPDIEFTGTATKDVDYTVQVTATGVVLTTLADGIYDPDETIILTLKGFTGNAELGSITVHTVTITETPLVVEFQASSNTRIEGQAQIIAFTVQLPAAVVPTFTITGTATQGIDYTYTQSQNSIVVTTLMDEIYDPNESVIIELTGVSGNAVLGARKTFTLTITDEDESLPASLSISLSWETEDGSAGDVDMDLLVWFETSPGVYTSKGSVWSAEIGTQFESTTIPANETNGKWGLSYVYYSGTSNNLKIKVDFRSYKGNINTTSNRVSYTATYTLANVRGDYDVFFDAGIDVIAQSYQKNNANYTDLTSITVATSGSRSKPVTFVLDEAARKIIERRAKHTLESKGD